MFCFMCLVCCGWFVLVRGSDFRHEKGLKNAVGLGLGLDAFWVEVCRVGLISLG